MRHRVAGKQLCLESDHRRALLRNLAAGLFEHGEIGVSSPIFRDSFSFRETFPIIDTGA